MASHGYADLEEAHKGVASKAIERACETEQAGDGAVLPG